MTNEYNFDRQGTTANFTVMVDTAANYGYFEHETLGEECAGGLWFEKATTTIGTVLFQSLVDYDGVAELPKQVISWLREQGFVVGEDFE